MNNLVHVDYDTLNNLRDIMEDDFRLLIETFIQDSHDRVTTLLQCAGTEELDSLRRAAHSFKGSCSNIGAVYLAQLCADVEAHALAGNNATMKSDVANIQQEFLTVESVLIKFLG
jgi:histidine phosphotransfer protein HptB